MQHPAVSAFLYKRKICILIPTYNNAKTLARVLNGVCEYTDQVLVINDGATDDTASILRAYPQIETVTLDQNTGKGNALKVGFRKARERGFQYAITIDSDGQHYPDDIPVFTNALAASDEPVLLIGSRNMNQETVPGKSSFGNRFSNFWYFVETGIRLQDTQSGYRLYPLDHIPHQYFTNKFEFEIEVIVRSSWRGIAVRNVPINVLYDPEERVSHFRPFRDFTRISILNTVLVSITICYVIPRQILRKIRSIF